MAEDYEATDENMPELVEGDGTQMPQGEAPVYLAPIGSHLQKWQILIPAGLEPLLSKELKRLRAHRLGERELDPRLANGGSTAYGLWEARQDHVASIMSFLVDQGLKDPGVLSLDDVLATMTLKERSYDGIFSRHSLPDILERLLILPDQTYAELAERAQRRTRPEVADALAALSEPALRWLAARPFVKAGNHHFTARTVLLDIELTLRGFIESPEQLADLMRSYHEPTDLYPEMSDGDLRALARQIIPIIREARWDNFSRGELVEIVADGYDRLPAATRADWEAQRTLVRARQAEHEEKAREAQAIARQEKRATYLANKDLYPYFGRILGHVIPLQNHWNEGGPPVEAQVTAVQDEESKETAQHTFDVQLSNGRDLRFDRRRVAKSDRWRTNSGLVFTDGWSYDYSIDLRPLLMRMLWTDHRDEISQLTAALPAHIVRYLGRAV